MKSLNVEAKGRSATYLPGIGVAEIMMLYEISWPAL
jgi:hypothetical protein